LGAINQITALSLQVAFLQVSRQRLAFLVAPAFFRVLSLQGTAQHIFDTEILAAGKPFVNEQFKVGRDV
jgi:hypothetical protein